MEELDVKTSPEVEDVLPDRQLHSRARKPAGPQKKIAAGILAAVLIAGGGAYAVRAQSYKTRFYPNTLVNGIDVSGCTSAETKARMNESVRSYTMTLKAREQADQQITADDAGLEYVFDDTFDNLIGGQNPYLWGFRTFGQQEYLIDTMGQIDETAFAALTDSLNCLDEKSFRQPVNARMSDFIVGTGYQVLPEEEGTSLNTEKARELIRTAMCELRPELDLNAEEGLYDAPSVRADDPVLNTSCESLNRYAKTVITYDYGDQNILDGGQICSWISLNEAGDQASVDEEKIAEYVKVLASKYDTYNKAKPLRTSWGQDITVKGGMYGWRVNQAEEKEWLLGAIATGENISRTPAFSKTAAAYGPKDYGDTYVEVNLTAQHLYFYKNGQEIVSSDFVSGNVTRGTVTHTGIYPLAYKQRNATLKGQGYSTPVKYWMPFNSGEGLHDASWRGSFGGNIYKTNGSHGCVNLPTSAAKKIFENIDAGTPIIIYSLGGTGTTATTPAAVPETTAAETTAAAETIPETAAAETPAESQAPRGPGEVLPVAETTAAAPSPAPAETVAETAAAVPSPAPAETAAETAAAAPEPAVVQPVPTAAPAPAVSTPETASSGPGMVQPVPETTISGPGA